MGLSGKKLLWGQSGRQCPTLAGFGDQPLGVHSLDDSHLTAERRAPKEGELSLGIGLVTCVKAHTHVSLNPRHQYERLKL